MNEAANSSQAGFGNRHVGLRRRFRGHFSGTGPTGADVHCVWMASACYPAISDLHQSQDFDRVSVVGISVSKSRSRLEPVVIPRYGSAQYLSTRDMQPRYLARWVIKNWRIVRYILDMYGVLVGSLQSLDVSFPAIPLSRFA